VELDDLADALAASLVAPQVASPPTWRWRDATPKDRVTLQCDNCGHRIVWWTTELRDGWLGLQDASHRGWKWQGQGEPPIRFRGEFVDAACRACGWAKPAVARQPQDWWTAAPEML
jgi:hypothetical protein